MQLNSRTLEANYVDASKLPWFPFLAEGVTAKLCKVNPISGEMVLFLHTEKGAGSHTHYHHGTVIVYTIKGSWRYLEDTWVAHAGDVIFEPSFSTHTFETSAFNG